MAYIVTAGRVSAETQVTEEGGRAVIDFYRGAVLPDDLPDETLQRFLREGLVEDEDAQPDDTEDVDDEGEKDEVDLSAMDKDGLLAYADEHELQVDRRLGEDKLRAAIQEAQ